MPQASITTSWQAYVAANPCTCSVIVPQSACAVHSYNTGHLPWTACNLVSPSAVTRQQGCNCTPVTPAQVATFGASGGLVPIPAAAAVVAVGG
jgi:hypothetical protein